MVTAVTKTAIASPHDSSMAPIATLWLSRLLRFVNSTISAKASSGGSGTSRVRISGRMSAAYHFIRLISSATTVERRR